MASASEPASGAPVPHIDTDLSGPVAGDSAVSIGRAGPDQWRQALSLLLTGRQGIEESAVRRFMGFAADQHLGLSNLWLVGRGGQLIGAALIVPCAGRTALIFLSPNLGQASASLGAALARAACRGQDPQQVRLIQALLDPGQEPIAEMLVEAGFRRLACLIYMERSAERGPVPLDAGPDIDVVHWSAQARPAFARAILATYEKTLDCPGLLGLRHIDDIIDGHMATGRFIPELWLALECRGRPVGVMLLNMVPQRDALELVYLGLSPDWRGRGIGRRLVAHALGLAWRQDAAQLLLAVDEQNTPAMRMYSALQFAPTARKTALILPLAEGNAARPL